MMRHMMATTAIHLLGDISRNEPDLCLVDRFDGKNYIGSWAKGFGFFNVKFPQETTRDLTLAEIAKYENPNRWLCMNGTPFYKMRLARGCLADQQDD